MTKLIEGTPVTALITPGRDDANDWPTHSAEYGEGGLQVVDTIAERDAISVKRRKNKVVVVKTDPSGSSAYVWNPPQGMWKPFDLLAGTSVFGNGGTYTGIAKLVFSSCKLVKKPLYPKSLYITPIITFHDEHTYSREANNIRVHAPLKLSDSPDFDNGMNLELDPDYIKGFEKSVTDKFEGYEKLHTDGYLSYTAASRIIKSYDGTEDPEGFLFFNDSPTMLTGRCIEPSVTDKTITIKSLDYPKDTMTPYYFAVQAYSRSGAVKAGQVTLSLVDADHPDVALNDINGKPIASTVQLAVGEQVGRIYLDSVITTTGTIDVKVKIQSTCGDIVLNGLTDGATGMVVAQLDDDSMVNPVIQQWSLDTGMDPNIVAYDFSDQFVTIPSVATLIAEGLRDARTFPADFQLHTADGLSIWSKSRFNTKLDEHSLYVDNSDFFTCAMIVDNERTRLMRGRRFNSVVTCRPVSSDYIIGMVYWEGDADSATYPIATGVDKNNRLILSKGWIQHQDTTTVKQRSDMSPIKIPAEFGVPDNIKNIGIIIYPADGKVLSSFGLEEMYFSPRSGDPKHVLYIPHDRFNGIPFKELDRVLPKKDVAVKRVKNTREFSFTTEVPAGCYFEISAVQHYQDGTTHSVSGITYKYEPVANKMTVTLPSTGDYTVAFKIYN